MKLLITGSNGLVGTALKSILKKKNIIFLTKKKLDLTNFSQTKEFFLKIKPTHIIHLAAQVGGIGGNLIHSGEYFRNNLLININVLESARLSKCKRLISFMSTCVFPDKAFYPLNEKQLHNGPPHQSNFGYAYAKRMLEVQSTAYRKEWGCDYIVAIPANIYGPNDNFNLTEGHVVPSLIHKIWQAKKNNKSLNVWGSGKPLREFVYSKDIAKLTLWALKNYHEETPIIFSSGKETSIANLVSLIADKMQFNGKINFDISKPDGQLRKPSDGRKLKKLNSSFKWTDLEKGIEETVKWFQKNYNLARI
jgi:GDP-L-fucose synthase